MLQGHERSITTVQYNREGDLVFSTSKDSTPHVWFADNGERLGTFDGHKGTVWDCSVDFMTERLLTASADNTARIWKVEDGSQMHAFEFKTPARVAEWSEGNKLAAFVTDRIMGHDAYLYVYAIAEMGEAQSSEPLFELGLGMKCQTARWSALNQSIYCGMDDGSVRVFDAETQQELAHLDGHRARVHDLSFSDDKQMFITASKDKTAMLWDVKSNAVIRTYRTEHPVNSAKISPIYDHVILGGGQDAMSVTTTHSRVGKFQVRFFHAVYEEELGGVTGHFGPINYLDFAPNGRGFTSGGEDGYVRIHHFDDSYYTQAEEFKLRDEIAAQME